MMPSCDGGGAAVSSSSITTTGSHVLRINGYSAGKLAMSNGSCAESCEFEAGGHTWRICYYPNGFRPSDADHISLMLRLVGGDATPSKSTPGSASPCSHGGGPSYGYSQSFSSGFGRTAASSLHGFPWFIKREVLEKSSSEYLVDDCFAVRCDIDVVHTTCLKGLAVCRRVAASATTMAVAVDVSIVRGGAATVGLRQRGSGSSVVVGSNRSVETRKSRLLDLEF